jgi:hypothetical protein
METEQLHSLRDESGLCTAWYVDRPDIKGRGPTHGIALDALYVERCRAGLTAAAGERLLEAYTDLAKAYLELRATVDNATKLWIDRAADIRTYPGVDAEREGETFAMTHCGEILREMAKLPKHTPAPPPTLTPKET